MYSRLLIFGRQPALSLAELHAFAEARGLSLSVRLSTSIGAVVVDGLPDAVADTLVEQLAGVVKVAVLLGQQPLVPLTDTAAWVQTLQPLIADASMRTFGISYYGTRASVPSSSVQERIALTIKKAARSNGGRVRWVSGRGKPLTSVQVEKNQMLGAEGSEFIVLVDRSELVIAKTTAVQLFEDWGSRDFGRPARDARSGMLPPKLARLMVNLLGLPPQGILLDPFCGSGTILMEAAVAGWASVIGSDKSAKAVSDSEENMAWLKNAKGISADYTFFKTPVAKLVSRVSGRSVAAVVSEPDLGPALRVAPTVAEAKRIAAGLLPLYRELLMAVGKVLRPGGRAVLVVPRWVTQSGEQVPLRIPVSSLPKNVYERLPTEEHQRDNALVYQRPDQRVIREIISFEAR
ncbi:hypothetical protein COV04_04090 [Candidatus Uhrbacteria bacterium CG10_big_fil_rev_8_21_14_0_10_48_11]|uniref:Ribosomal RNA large subunit methyltransferase K/L-like methyltransferase domain-containing protein n=1 Tax=Candidatus Uhrbacteria bacterium CG10_big_fil_rev_8_21_14_0_10_48_11 TaxID=1975037 RepID=A0A2M8LDP8_9BACT|nr:MAG: hypothetical protein COV04_04090 [Candidatus Uhrbacteria bacterium CG10_big_fil_rev_8_21_14_0_10_48_11]